MKQKTTFPQTKSQAMRNLGNLANLMKILVLTLTMNSALYAQVHPALGGGDGLTELTAFRIETHLHLKQLADFVNESNANSSFTNGKYYKLINDLDLSSYNAGEGWQPIGNAETRYFRGIFDGNNKQVQNLTVHRPLQNYIGLFGYLLNATVKNLGVLNCTVEGQMYTGGIL